MAARRLLFTKSVTALHSGSHAEVLRARHAAGKHQHVVVVKAEALVRDGGVTHHGDLVVRGDGELPVMDTSSHGTPALKSRSTSTRASHSSSPSAKKTATRLSVACLNM